MTVTLRAYRSVKDPDVIACVRFCPGEDLPDEFRRLWGVQAWGGMLAVYVEGEARAREAIAWLRERGFTLVAHRNGFRLTSRLLKEAK